MKREASPAKYEFEQRLKDVTRAKAQAIEAQEFERGAHTHKTAPACETSQMGMRSRWAAARSLRSKEIAVDAVCLAVARQ